MNSNNYWWEGFADDDIKQLKNNLTPWKYLCHDYQAAFFPGMNSCDRLVLLHDGNWFENCNDFNPGCVYRLRDDWTRPVPVSAEKYVVRDLRGNTVAWCWPSAEDCIRPEIKNDIILKRTLCAIREQHLRDVTEAFDHYIALLYGEKDE